MYLIEALNKLRQDIQTWVINNIHIVIKKIGDHNGDKTSHQDIRDILSTLTDKNFITEIPDEYITEDELINKGYLTNQDISNLATKDDIPNVIDNFESTSSTDALSAAKGAELNTRINEVADSIGNSGGGEKVQADLFQTDFRAPDFVKNKIVGYYPDIIPENTIEFVKAEGLTENVFCSISNIEFFEQLKVGFKYTVHWNDNKNLSQTAVRLYSSENPLKINGVYVGNIELLTSEELSWWSDDWLIVYDYDEDTYKIYIRLSNEDVKTHTFKIQQVKVDYIFDDNIIRLDESWIDTRIARKSDIPQPDLLEINGESKNFVANQYFGLWPDNVTPADRVFRIEQGNDISTLSDFEYTTPIIEGYKYKIIWGEEEYLLTAKLFNDWAGAELTDKDWIALGNTNLIAFNKNENLEEKSLPIVFMSVPELMIGLFITNDFEKADYDHDESFYCGIVPVEREKKLDTKWLSDDVATKAFVEDAIANIGGSGGSTPSVGEIDILSEGNFNFEINEDSGGMFQAIVPLTKTSFIVGETYNVVFDSNTYKGITAKSFVMPGGDLVCLYLGNASLLDSSFENTQEKFLCAIVIVEGVIMGAGIITPESGTSHKVRIYQEKEPATIIEKDVFAEQTASGFVFDETYQAYANEPIPAPFTLTEGESYYVEWDGIKHLCVADTTTSPVGSNIIFIGNGIYVGKNGNGEDFLIAYDSTYNAIQFFSLTSTESHTVRIYQTEVVLNKPDWNENNPDSPNYIANRPFYEIKSGLETILPETQIDFSEYGPYEIEPTPEMISLWESDWSEAIVMWDNTEYICKPRDYLGLSAIGNIDLMLGTGDTGEPFAFVIDGIGDVSGIGRPGAFLFSALDVSQSHTVSIKIRSSSIKTLDSKFISEIPWSKIADAPFRDISSAGEIIYDGIVNLTDEFENLFPGKLNIVNGGRYIVNLNGVSYECEAFEKYEGDIALTMLTFDTGEKQFGIVYINKLQMSLIEYKIGEHTLTITAASDIIKKIDNKYLPGATKFNLSEMGLPAIPISGEFVTSETDTTALIEALGQGPINVTVTANAGQIIEISSIVNGAKAFDTYQANTTVVFNNMPILISIEISSGEIRARAIHLSTSTFID